MNLPIFAHNSDKYFIIPFNNSLLESVHNHKINGSSKYFSN